MLRYKNSNYNVIFEDGDEVVFVNLLTEAIATVNKEKYNKIKKIMESPNKEWSREYADLKNDLIYGGYLIEENFDEMQHLKIMNYRSRYDASFLSFTIMPTMRCNLDCIYCYETHEGPTMDDQTTETVANYISMVAKSKRRIHIGWFGGEPLLRFDTIKYINEKVIKTCEEYKTNFSSSISTNGYLLSAEKAKLFDELMIRNVQITLDGPKEYHDKYRPLKGGGPTFDTLFENIKNFFKLTKEARITLRVNVGPDNYDAIYKLVDALKILPKDRLRIYFRWIFQGGETEKEIHREVMNFRGENSYEKLAKFYYYASQKGFETFLPILSNPIYCEYDCESSILIGPKGEVFPCTVAVNEGNDFGKVTDNGIEYDKTKYLIWHKHDAFQDEECKKCKLLPQCFGGCRNAIVNSGFRGCPEEKTALESFARLWYFTKDMERKLKAVEKDENIKV